MVESVSSRKTKKVVIGRQRKRTANNVLSPFRKANKVDIGRQRHRAANNMIDQSFIRKKKLWYRVAI